MNKLGAAIIGCGTVHGAHGDAVMCSELGHLLYVADIEQERAQTSAQRYNCLWCTDYHEMLKNDAVDVVHICTPHYLHAEMAIEAVRAGKHVLVEKPVAIHVKQAEEMAVEAEKYGRYIAVCFQNRYNPTSVKVRELIKDGTLGAVKGVKGLVTWYRNAQYYTQSQWRGRFATEGGGVLINQAIHTLDLMQWLSGGVKSVKGNVSTRLLGDTIEVEDTADATLFLKNGAVGIFYATNCYTTNSSVEIEVHCEKGILKLCNGELVIEHDGEQNRVIDENCTHAKYKSYWGNSHAVLIEEFYRGILEKDPGAFISVEEGMESLKIIDAIYKSSSTGNKINI